MNRLRRTATDAFTELSAKYDVSADPRKVFALLPGTGLHVYSDASDLLNTPWFDDWYEQYQETWEMNAFYHDDDVHGDEQEEYAQAVRTFFDETGADLDNYVVYDEYTEEYTPAHDAADAARTCVVLLHTRSELGDVDAATAHALSKLLNVKSDG